MASKWQPESKEDEIQHIIQKLTTTGRKTLDEEKMTKLKKICKYCISCIISCLIANLILL